MRHVKYNCDHCKKEYCNDAELITLGTDGSDLRFKNPHAKIGETGELARYRDLHFCKKECFVNYFFDRGELTENNMKAKVIIENIGYIKNSDAQETIKMYANEGYGLESLTVDPKNQDTYATFKLIVKESSQREQ